MTTRLRFRACLLSAIALFCGATTAGVAHADTIDIGTGGTVDFGASDCLTNTGGITAATISFSEGSDLSGVDFSGLGLTSLTLSTANNDNLTTWDGANFSGLSLTLTGNNQFRSDSFVGTDFSGATINAAGNQPFVTAGGAGLNLTDANFSGATFNLGSLTTLGFAVYAGGGSLAGADFTDTIWNYTGAGNNASFSIGPGSTSIADSASAADFSGADFSGVTADNAFNFTRINLGGFAADGVTPIGAFYDANTVLPTGVTTAELDAVGWQFVSTTAVPEPSSLALLGLGGLGMLMRRRK